MMKFVLKFLAATFGILSMALAKWPVPGEDAALFALWAVLFAALALGEERQ